MGAEFTAEYLGSPAIALPGQISVSQQVRVAAQQDIAAGRLPFQPGSLSDLQLAREGLPSAGQYSSAQLGAGIPTSVLPPAPIFAPAPGFTPTIVKTQTPQLTTGGGGIGGFPFPLPFPIPGLGGGPAQPPPGFQPPTWSVEIDGEGILFLFNQLSGVLDLSTPVTGQILEFCPFGGGDCTVFQFPNSSALTPGFTLKDLVDQMIAASFASIVHLFRGQIISQSPAPNESPAQTSTEVENINNVINISNDIGSSITDAITSAISAQNDSIKNAIQPIFGDIYNAIQGEADNISTFTDNLLNGITNVLGGIGSQVGNALGFALSGVFGGIKDVLGGIRDVIAPIGQSIAGKIEALIQSIKDNGVSAVIPVIQLIVTAIADVKLVLATIEGDLNKGLGALVLLPEQIASSFVLLGQSIGQATGRLNFVDGASLGTQVAFQDTPLPAAFIESFSTILTPKGGPQDLSSLISSIISLADPCHVVTSAEALNKLAQIMGKAPEWVQWLWRPFIDVINVLTATGGILKKQLDLALEDANKVCPVTKLDENSAVTAWLRNILTDEALKAELVVKGYDDTRIAVLKSLAAANIDVGTIIDSWFRGFVNDTDLDKGLKVLGYSQAQIEILKLQGQAVPGFQQWLRWLTYGQITENEFDLFMHTARYQQQDIDAIKATYQTRETTNQEILLDGRINARGIGYPGSSVAQTPPAQVLAAAKRDGVTVGNAELQWLEHWVYPSYTAILQSDFRHLSGLAGIIQAILAGNLSGLQDPTLGFERTKAAMQAENIPPELWQDLIQLARPLIPFRSIPAFVRAGIMTQEEGAVELMGHGFDPQRISWILHSVTKTAKTTAATAVSTVQNLSIASAKQLFLEGAINEEQYLAILEEHKYPPDVARLQVQADLLHAETKQRSQFITDSVNEVLAGQVSIDNVLQTLHAGGYTDAEIARFQKEVRRATTSVAKHPTIADLKTFLKAQIITLDQFKNELQLQGWNDPWLSAFVQLETPPPV